MGDPAGIGPEICLQVLRDPALRQRCVPIVFGDQSVLQKVAAHLRPAADLASCQVVSLSEWADVCDQIDCPQLGVTVDVYHLWWDGDLETEIQRCGRAGRIFSFHVCDWRTPTEDLLNDRGLMGEGCIDVRQIRGWVEEAGFHGFIEVEVFSNRYWAMDQEEFLRQIKEAYRKHT